MERKVGVQHHTDADEHEFESVPVWMKVLKVIRTVGPGKAHPAVQTSGGSWGVFFQSWLLSHAIAVNVEIDQKEAILGFPGRKSSLLLLEAQSSHTTLILEHPQESLGAPLGTEQEPKQHLGLQCLRGPTGLWNEALASEPSKEARFPFLSLMVFTYSRILFLHVVMYFIYCLNMVQFHLPFFLMLCNGKELSTKFLYGWWETVLYQTYAPSFPWIYHAASFCPS